MKKIIMLALALFLFIGSAFAEIKTTGNVNLRKGPGLDYDTVATVQSGTMLEDGDSIMTDDRGVDWYLVYYKGKECWISSKYAVITSSDFESQPISDEVELSIYYQMDLEEAANILFLKNYSNMGGELSNRYYSKDLSIMGNDTLEAMAVYSDRYSVFGAVVGMDRYAATNACIENGLRVQWVSAEAVVLDHFEFVGGAEDGCINLYIDSNGLVYEIDWSTYTSP